ncbi:hypothetical protein [Halapricum hydrolyticum]|uniref:DUF7847 domain-containing protein n=1 Tax=Halapricum hydrolyticum TaxID=2979991 RepID=A0AAE3LIM1_9EURY|nr:hypothetical protein [Halapricum hydrolyticum]MCU4719473.1 hypothetical protein [Halapricum hydrolyticum]MCU4728084.1 hypothetical protein [Halapricum hydrolyticum]
MSADPFDDPALDESLDLYQLLADAVDSLLSMTGAQIVASLAIVGIASDVLAESLLVRVFEDTLTLVRENADTSQPEVQQLITDLERTIEAAGLTVDLSAPVLLVGLLALAILVEAIRIVAVRAFANDELDGVPRALAARRLPIAAAYGFVAVILIYLAIGIVSVLTFFLLFVPALFVYIGLLFVRQEIAVADKGPIQAISGSWGLVKGNRWEILGLAVVLFLVTLGTWVLASLLVGPAGTVGGALLGAVNLTFGTALVTEAYVRLSARSDDRPDRQPSI